MKALLKSVFVSLALSTLAVSAGAQTVVWDQGPATGAIGGSWMNQTGSQNFADKVSFANDTIINGFNYFTSSDLSSRTGSSAFHLKIFSDNASNPGTALYQTDLGFTSFGASSNAQLNVATFLFSSQLFAANTAYWVGLSGNGFEASQVSVLSPQDGEMAMFHGSTYSSKSGVGDQMFQLTTPVPEPETYALLLAGLGLIGATVIRRKAKQA